MSLREQFEKETGIVSWVKCDGTTLFTEDYTEWLEKLNTKLQQGLSANQHDTAVMCKDDAEQWEDQREAMFNAWENKQK